MKLHIIFIMGLMNISSFAGYKPQWFSLHLGIKNAQITPGILLTMYINPPLYFTLPDGSRDYLKYVTFNISRRDSGNYDVDYDMTSYKGKHKTQTKGTKKDIVEPLLRRTFPQVFTSTGEQKRYSLRALEKNEADRAVFKNVVDLMNGLLPQNAQLNFDEKDFSEITFNEWRGWFSRSAWHNWWQWRRELSKNR